MDFDVEKDGEFITSQKSVGLIWKAQKKTQVWEWSCLSYKNPPVIKSGDEPKVYGHDILEIILDLAEENPEEVLLMGGNCFMNDFAFPMLEVLHIHPQLQEGELDQIAIDLAHYFMVMKMKGKYPWVDISYKEGLYRIVFKKVG